MSRASTYTRMTGGCTTHIATAMLSTVNPTITPASYILDNACGPGTVTTEIKSRHPAARIMATDLSPAMIAEVQESVQRNGWSDVETAVLDVRALTTLADDTFTHIFANLALPVPGDAESGVKIAREMFRVLEIGGVAMASTWAGGYPAFTRTSLRIRPDQVPQNAMAMAPEYLAGSWLLQQFEKGGFGNNVELRPVVTYSSASSLEELVGNMMLAQGMFFAGFGEEELERATLLLEEELSALRTFEKFDGGVRIGMKAWVATGWKKGDEGR